MQDRGIAAYIAELVGTFFLVFFITSIGVLYVSVGESAQFGSDFAVVGLTIAFVLTALIIGIGVASGGHFNPAVTFGAALMKKISPIDAVIYILAQLSGGILGALLTKGLLEDEGTAGNYGAAEVTDLLGGNFQGAIVEMELPIHMSNVSPVVDGKPTRVRFATKADGSKVRVAARNGAELSTLHGPRTAKKAK